LPGVAETRIPVYLAQNIVGGKDAGEKPAFTVPALQNPAF
jgi:hypothetical protein